VARIALVVIWILVWVSALGAELRWIDIDRSTITVHFSRSGTQRADVADYVIEAPLAEGSLDDIDTPHLALVMNVSQLRVVDPGRSADERQAILAQMLGSDGLDAERFSRIVYHSLTIDQIEAGVWLVRGELGMRGRFLPLNFSAVRQGDRFTGTTKVLPTDFGIPPERLAGTSTSLINEVQVDFDIVLEAP
jgi:hypothetical protein